jgi:hypothetical protein
MAASHMKRMKELKFENRRIKKMYLEKNSLQRLLLRLSIKIIKPARRRELAKQVQSECGISV